MCGRLSLVLAVHYLAQMRELAPQPERLSLSLAWSSSGGKLAQIRTPFCRPRLLEKGPFSLWQDRWQDRWQDPHWKGASKAALDDLGQPASVKRAGPSCRLETVPFAGSSREQLAADWAAES